MSIFKSLEKQRQTLQNKQTPEPIESSSKSQVSGKIPFVLHHYRIIIFLHRYCLYEVFFFEVEFYALLKVLHKSKVKWSFRKSIESTKTLHKLQFRKTY